MDVLKSFSNGDRGIEWMDRVRERMCAGERDSNHDVPILYDRWENCYRYNNL